MCSFTAALVRRNRAHGNKARHRSIGRRVERVGRLRQLDREGLVADTGRGVSDEHLRKVGEDPPIAGLVRIGQRAPRDAAAEPGVVQLRLQRPQARLDVAEALAVRQLGEGQTEQLVVAGERPEPARARVPLHASLEGAPGDDVHHLGEHRCGPYNIGQSFPSRVAAGLLARVYGRIQVDTRHLFP